MPDEKLQKIVTAVISRIAQQMGADGSRGTLVTVFTGATVAFQEAASQVRGLILDGYRIQMAFSQNAEDLYGREMRDQLAGFPNVSFVEPSTWLLALKEAHAIIVPLLSLNTLSKVSMLIADNLPTNLILHGLFFGKTVLASKTAAHPDEAHWNQKFGSRQSSQALRKALLKRLQIVDNYGCYLTDTHMLREAVNYFLKGEQGSKAGGPLKTRQKLNSSIHIFESVVTSAKIRQAYILGVDLTVSPGAVVTPLARDLANQYGVNLNREDAI
jgi:hypothetical protein